MKRTNLLILLGCLLFRALNSLLIQTFYSPDEYWQSLEVAHQYVFNFPGHETLTWEWHHKIRSFLHPAMFSLVYYALKFLELDQNYSLVSP
jgi:GPI mannosyltransferase 3